MTNHDEQLKAVARLVSGRPDWIDAPAVQAWHRSDGRTEHDGTPGKPRIWSPDHRTTERWSTPSLQNVHWSDLVDVVPLAAPAGSYTRTDEWRDPRDEEIERLRGWIDRAERFEARAEKAERERDEARGDVNYLRELVEGDTNRVTRIVVVGPGGSEFEKWGIYTHGARLDLQDEGRTLKIFPADPPTPERPDGAEEWEDWLIETLPHESMPDEDIALLADRIAARVTEDGAR